MLPPGKSRERQTAKRNGVTMMMKKIIAITAIAGAKPCRVAPLYEELS